MEEFEVVLEILNDDIMHKIVMVSRNKSERQRRQQVLRLLLYSHLKEVFASDDLVNHLSERIDILKNLGFRKLPNAEEIEKWKKDFDYEAQQVLDIVLSRYLQLKESEWTVLDPIPMIEIVP